MRVINNNRAIRHRARLGQIANLGGLIVLGAGLAISLLRPQWSLYTLGLLIIGVIASQYGIATAYRYARKPRPDEELANALKGLDDRHRLYNYVLPAYHVLLTPRRLYVLVTKGMAGKVVAEGRRWHMERRFSLGRLLRLFAPENLGNPVREAEWDRDAIQQWARQHADGLEVEVEPLVVFLSPQADIEARSPEVKPVRAKALKDALRKPEGTGLSSEAYRSLANAFDEAAGPQTPESEDSGAAKKKGRA
ncbi:MAG: nuclease-related domain-containing protein [Anaerolineae bacterium]